MKALIAIALCACGSSTPPPKPSGGSAEPPAGGRVADPLWTACQALVERCPGTDPQACLATLRAPRERCGAKASSYTSCAAGCLPSVKCEDDAALNCNAGCEDVECKGAD